MIDVGDKDVTQRVAVAEGALRMDAATLGAIVRGEAPKGDPLPVARIAGIQGAKRTPELIPLCHPLPLTGADVELHIDESLPGVRARATVKTRARTGVEMEALAAVTTALLTVYDMAKALDRGMRLEDVRVVRKEGGRSGTWTEEASS